MQTPEHAVATMAVLGISVVAAARFIHWLFSGPVKSDPWGDEISARVDDPESLPVCHRCLTEHPGSMHFCPQCGAAVGDYNNVLPFDQIYSEGEVFRNGTNMKMRPGALIIAGYILLSLSAYAIFAPVYWLVLLRNLLRREEPPLSASIG